MEDELARENELERAENLLGETVVAKIRKIRMVVAVAMVRAEKEVRTRPPKPLNRR
jgi:hypothetical protein